ncbi:ParB/RepB/Spo0J family partition protein [Candidatus Peregrinibacteria bacterium]|nr:ParB/RepB/Spo0J family partition protein [Candidatus Peregrinibacteria bacterium]
MSPEAQSIDRPGLPSPNRITSSRLREEKITAVGGNVLNGLGTLVRIPGIENQEFQAAFGECVVIPNPNQPRTYFDPERMAELSDTLKSEGQLQAVVTVPYRTKDGAVKLLIVDGERRFRALKNLGKDFLRIVVRWAGDEEVVLKRSLILDATSLDHNAIEKGRTYKQIIAIKRAKGSRHAVEELAKEIGVSKPTIHTYVSLLELSEEIQQMVAEGNLSHMNAVAVVVAQRRYDDKLDKEKVARVLQSHLADGEKHTISSVRAAIRSALSGEGYIKTRATADLSAHRACKDLVHGTTALSKGVEDLLAADPRAVVAALQVKVRGASAEVLRDTLLQLRDKLPQVIHIIEKAIPGPGAKKISS